MTQQALTGLSPVDDFITDAEFQRLVVSVKAWTIPAEVLELSGTVMVPPHHLVQVTVTMPRRTRFAHGRVYHSVPNYTLISVWGRFEAPGRRVHWLSGSWREGKRMALIKSELHASTYLDRMGGLLVQGHS